MSLNPEDVSGYKTYQRPPRKPKNPKRDHEYGERPGGPDQRERVLPLPNAPGGQRTRMDDSGGNQPSYNGPPASKDSPDGRSLHKDKVRTIGVPGEQYGNPTVEQGGSIHKRRYMAQRIADFYMDVYQPEQDPDAYSDRATPAITDDGDNTGDVLNIREVPGNPGSAKVIPYGHGFENRKGMMRVAVKIADIERACGPDVHQRSQGIPVKLRRVDKKNSMWLFDVKGSKGAYRVRVQARKKGNFKDVKKADVFVSCGCPFWQWQGPEHWASQQGYLYGKPRGTATRPDSKDPRGKHGACKHVLAVLRFIGSYQIPETRRMASQVVSVKRVADRYLLGRRAHANL